MLVKCLVWTLPCEKPQSLFLFSTLYFFTVFHCKNDFDCYNKGICNDGVCACQPGWQEQTDCTGTVVCIIVRMKSFPRFWRNKLIFTQSTFFAPDFYCLDDSHCNEKGSCNIDLGNCACEEGWNVFLDCTFCKFRINLLFQFFQIHHPLAS